MSNLFVTSEFSKELGGAAKTISLFRRVLGGTIVGFNSSHFDDEDGVVKLPCESGLLGKKFGYSKNTQPLDESTNDIKLISCHLLYRYHCNWSRKTAQQNDIPYWVVPHGALDPFVFSYRSLQKKLWLSLSGRRLMKQAARVIFATKREQEKASQFIDVSNGTVINWPVLPISRQNEEERRSNWRKRFSIPTDARVLIYLGRFTEMKRPLHTIDAFAKAKQCEKVHLVFVGNDSGITADQLRAFRPDGLANRIHIIGPQWGSDRDDALVAADGFISLSHRENFGHTAAEALSAGLPVILSPGNDLTGEFEGKEFGKVLQTDKLDEAIDAMEWFAKADPLTLKRTGADGCEWVNETISFERFQNSLLDLYNEVVN